MPARGRRPEVERFWGYLARLGEAKFLRTYFPASHHAARNVAKAKRESYYI
jgi:hypothetical protein